MLSFFGVGEIYRNGYRVEHVVKFFDGELAVARKDDQRFYLQSAMLQKQAPSRAIQQYRTLHHPLVLPYDEVYTEERSIVFIRPYEAIHPLREVISSREVDEDQVVEWGRQLLSLEIELKSKPMPMYLLLDPRNIGLNDQDELRVLFCGLEQITAQSRTLDWGSFFFSLLSGQYLEEPLDKMPADFPCSKPMSRLIQRSLKKQSPESVLSQIDAYKKKQKQGGGFFDFLFGSTKEETKPRPKKVEAQAAKEQPVPKQQKDEELSPVTETPAAPADNREEQEQLYRKLEEERLEQLRLEFERRQEELLRKQREELERKQQELLEKQRQEFEQKERELLAKQKEEFKQRITEPEEQESWEREQEEKERLEQEKKEQERLEQERLEQEKKEQERLEEEKCKREEAERARQEEERRAWEQRERERIEKEQEDRVQAELEKLKQERLEWEKKRQELERKEEELKERLQKEFEVLAQKLLEKQEEEFRRRQEEMLKAQRELLESKTKERLEKQREELEQTSKRYLITPQHTKPRASLFDLLPKDHQLKGKPQSEAEPTPPAEEQPEQVDPQPPVAEAKQEKEKRGSEEKASLRQEKLERESQEQDQLALQFEEYMKQMMGDES
ncbi:hypothetical protein [Laceyella tengchongensis]|uniref:hypothetical protein n=1 Tax=Laceyella tengchongensis TaxID=574699 RepID=UPI0012B84537|nr:hypothetical protein [Laceyella tengchongensis]